MKLDCPMCSKQTSKIRSLKTLIMLVRVELTYMQCNISDRWALFRCSVLIILEMARLDTLFLCSVGQQAWLSSSLVLNFFAKTKTFRLIKLFL